MRKICLSVIGSAILAFGMYQIHSQGAVTEGGILGLTLLFYHWLGISPSLSAFLLNALCYLVSLRVLGKSFLFYSALSGGLYSLFYSLFERSPLLWPNLSAFPLICAIAGALFVGVGIGFCVRAGGAPSGDDALAMSLEKLTTWPIERFYLISDMTVLLLSLSYIPVEKIFYSLITVTLSGKLIGWIQRR
jgi:uncharacterized membrane-anchored protein YitT (DUF2179 family)